MVGWRDLKVEYLRLFWYERSTAHDGYSTEEYTMAGFFGVDWTFSEVVGGVLRFARTNEVRPLHKLPF